MNGMQSKVLLESKIVHIKL